MLAYVRFSHLLPMQTSETVLSGSNERQGVRPHKKQPLQDFVDLRFGLTWRCWSAGRTDVEAPDQPLNHTSTN